MARAFPGIINSRDVYARLGLDSKKPGDKKIASRVMKAASFAAKRGRRWAVWEKIRYVDSLRQEEKGPVASPHSLLLAHHTDTATVTPESTM